MHDDDPTKAAAPRVLFVDDSRLIRFAARRFLRDQFDVVLAEDGGQAWNILQQDNSIQFVVTDLMMPEVDGLELIRRIRQAPQERIRALPILVVTSMEEKAGRRRALNAGANALVGKPFSGQDLIEPLRKRLRGASDSKTFRIQSGRLPNVEQTRDCLVNRVEQIGSFHDRHGLEFSILHVRLDDYETTASQFGLKRAEALMHHAERILARELRTEDTIGRSDDAVFSLILMATPAIGAKQLRTRLREHLARNPARFAGHTMDLNVSFCIQCPDGKGSRSADAILKAGLERLAEPANVTRLADRITG